MKRLILTLIMMVGIFASGSSIYADSEFEMADASIKAEIEAEFYSHKTNMLDKAKAEFHAKEDDTFNDAQLGDGIAFYHVSEQDTPPLAFVGYQFPIYLHGKQAGTLQAEIRSGKWKITEISSISDLDQKLQAAKANYKGNGHMKYIDDIRLGIQSVYVKDADNREQIIDLKSNHASSVSEFQDGIAKIKKERAANAAKNKDGLIQLGAGQPQASPSSSTAPYSWFAALAVLFLIPAVYLFVKRRNGNIHP